MTKALHRHNAIVRRESAVADRPTRAKQHLQVPIIARGFLIAGLLCATGAFAESTPPGKAKAAWAMTQAERLEARMNPTARAERVRQSEQRAGRSIGVPPADVLDGQMHPELFFPMELFESLVRVGFGPASATYPKMLQQRSSDLFRSPGEWERFEEITAEYRSLLQAQSAALSRFDQLAVDDLQTTKCRAGASALAASREAFGAERFDRVLYDIVAPALGTSYSVDTDFEKVARALIRKEEGCR
jgi:hypothetical protein